MRGAVAGVVLATALSWGCSYRLEVAPCKIRCTSNQHCPAAMVCNPDAGFCEAPGQPPASAGRCPGVSAGDGAADTPIAPMTDGAAGADTPMAPMADGAGGADTATVADTPIAPVADGAAGADTPIAPGDGAAGAAADTPRPDGGVLSLTSDDFVQDDTVYVDYSCAPPVPGNNESYQLSWTAGPAGTQSYVLTAGDRTVDLWIVWDIPAATLSVPRELPTVSPLTQLGNAQQKNAAGGQGFYGPCPREGQSVAYYFRVMAIDVASLTGLSPTANVATIRAEADRHRLASGQLAASFQHR